MRILKYIKPLFFSFLFLYCNITFSSETHIAIDGSASMKGFFVNGRNSELHKKLIRKLVRVTNSSINKDVKLYTYFKKGKSRVEGGSSPYTPSFQDFGRITLLNKCFDNILDEYGQADIVYLITDNVQDPDGDKEEQGDIEKFYSQLRSTQVKWIHLFPLALQFDGPVYGRDGRTRIINRYQGRRGLIVYSILLNSRKKKEYLKQIKQFGETIGFKGIDAKLIKGETVKVVSTVIDDYTESGNILQLKDGQLISSRKKPFQEGEKIEGQFEIGFQSKLNYVEIDRPSVKVELIENFKFLGLSGQSSDFTADKPKVTCDPPRLKHAIVPGNYEKNKLPKVRVNIVFENGVQFKKSLGALLRYLSMSKAGEFNGTIRVSLKVRSDNVKLVDSVVKRYATTSDYFKPDSSHLQTRILNLGCFFKETHDFSDVLAESYPVNFKINYPIWPLFFYLLLLILLIALIIYLWKHRTSYELVTITDMEYSIKRIVKTRDTAGNDFYGEYNGGAMVESDSNYANQTQLNLTAISGTHTIYTDEQYPLASIRKIPLLGFLVTAATGYLVNNKSRYLVSPAHGNLFRFTEKTDVFDFTGSDPSPDQGSSDPPDYGSSNNSPSKPSGFEDYPDYDS